MKLFRSIAIAAIIVTAACASTSKPNLSMTADQAEFVAEAAYNGFATAEDSAMKAGLLSVPQKAQLKSIDTQAYDALLLARTGKGQADVVLKVIAQAQPLLPSLAH